MPEGEIRADPWVVTEAVATAVAVLERLHTSTWLFPATLFTDGRDGATVLRSRVGGSRSETRINYDIAEFLAWVETYCTKHGRSDRIPHSARPGPPGHLLRSPAPHPGLVHRPPATGSGCRHHPVRAPPRPDDPRLRRPSGGNVEKHLPAERVRDIVLTVVRARAGRRSLAQALHDDPSLLRTGRPPAPYCVAKLLMALNEAGAQNVALPR
ncbi:hypothetical protein [Streptomyces paradoxus]|uniref:hypothetical protein n=1 Tax=Streptomyces paradoxus TaxID=66375 RepID=UPI0037CEC8B9